MLPQNELRGGGASAFETLYADPARLKGFLKAMTGMSHGANLAIAAKFPWAKYKTVVDAGPAQGDLAGAGGAGESAPARASASTSPEVGPDLSKSMSKQNGLSLAACSFSRRQLFRPIRCPRPT